MIDNLPNPAEAMLARLRRPVEAVSTIDDTNTSNSVKTPPAPGYDGLSRTVGRPRSGKETITLRLSTDMLNHYRALGKGWQAKLNDDLVKISKS